MCVVKPKHPPRREADRLGAPSPLPGCAVALTTEQAEGCNGWFKVLGAFAHSVEYRLLWRFRRREGGSRRRMSVVN